MRRLFFLVDHIAGSLDHVLDCEGIHAHWEIDDLVNRGMTFKMRTALVTLRTYHLLPWSLTFFSEIANNTLDAIATCHSARHTTSVKDPAVNPQRVIYMIYNHRYN